MSEREIITEKQQRSKICAICGVKFMPTRQTQRYCFECGSDPRRASQKYIRAELINRTHAGDKKQKLSAFAFNNAQGTAYISHRCLICGKPLKVRQDACCSDDCKKKLLFRLAAKDKRYRICPICNKVYAVDERSRGLCPECRATGKEVNIIGEETEKTFQAGWFDDYNAK